ncbi:hypothetical protein D3C87_1807780 [compost metagenome]
MKCLLRRFLQQQVDLAGFYRFLHGNAEIDCRDVDGRNTHGNGFKTVMKLGENSGNAGRQFGIHRNDRLTRRASASQVRMVCVNDLLIVHRGMDRRNRTRLNAIGIVQQFDHRNNAVGGA